MAHIFIAYSREDGAAAHHLATHAGSHDARYDAYITGGKAWWSSVLQEIEGCDLFVYLISPDALQAAYCQQEVREALRLGKPLLPVLVRDADPAQSPDDIAVALTRPVDIRDGDTTPLWRAVNERLRTATPGVVRSDEPTPRPVVDPEHESKNFRHMWLTLAVILALAAWITMSAA